MMTQSLSKALPITALPIPLAVALLGGCSSGSDSDSPTLVAGLTAPEGVSVVDPDTSDVSTGSGNLPNSGLQFPAGSDYVNDAAAVRVIDPSVEAVSTANGILCQIGMTRFWEFVNQPAYMAQVDTTLCGDEPEISESGSVTPRIHVFTMDVDRESNTAPQTASLWLPLEESGIPTQIYGEVVVSSSPTETDRYGAFQLTYAGVPDGGTVDEPLIFGVLSSDEGDNGLRFVEGFGDINTVTTMDGESAALSQLVVIRDPVTGEGAAKITQSFREFSGGSDSGILSTTWRVVFDAANVVRELDSNGPVALSRGDYVNHVYRYNLYHNIGDDLGQRVDLNAGVNVELPSGAYAWVGYHGAWAPFGESFSNGNTVEVETDAGIVNYDVVQAPGRLKRVTREGLLLTELGSQRFEWWEGANRYQVAYNAPEWQRVAQWNGSTESWDEIVAPTMIDVGAAGGFLNMYSQALGGVNFEESASEITYFLDTLVLGSDPVFTGLADLELFATVNAIKSEISVADANAGDIYLAEPVNISNAHRYVFNPATMVMSLDSGGGVLVGVGLDTGVEPDQGPNQWGMQSGPMVTATQLASMSDIYDVFDETEFYFYETGHNTWNQFIGLTDATGAFLEFDPPLDMLYNHSTANDMNGDATYDGQQILLNYNGPGQLFGIPGDQVDLGGQDTPWLPNFSLKDGTVVGANSEYIIRALGVDQTLVVDGGGAPQLDITDADALTVPDASLYVTPDIGAPPVITDPPAVINGEIQ